MLWIEKKEMQVEVEIKRGGKEKWWGGRIKDNILGERIMWKFFRQWGVEGLS